ncbi:hypothetical protein IV203_023162 [Nitzschia inconspicua]|uniref:Uncharacterized protein n=1 Tax=Nitzschia inconspicua TaxID=303405 RepID=A0A9K3KD47_9STRA|nr:hypothetical protein IV203_023162 [Nitzschia inconspicua]
MATLEEPPSLVQVRRKLHGAETIEDYVWNTSMGSLAELASLRRRTVAIPNLRDDSPACNLFMQQFQRYKENNIWPMRRGALEKFTKDRFLTRLRTSSFPGYEHKSGHLHELVKGATEGAKRKCVLCFVSKKNVPEASRLHGKEVSSNSSFMCRICMVCLCMKKLGGSTAKSCYEVQAEENETDLQLQEEGKEHGDFELEEEDQEDKQEGDKTDEDDIEAEEIEEPYYDDVYFPEDSDSLQASSEGEEEDSE